MISQQVLIHSPQDIVKELQKLLSQVPTTKIYLFWQGDRTLPYLVTDLNLVVSHWDKIRDVRSAFYIVSDEFQYVVEVQDDVIKLGLRPQRG